MDQQYVFESCWGRLDELSRQHSAFSEKTIAHQLKFADGKNVALANVCVITRCIEDLHRPEDITDFSRKCAKTQRRTHGSFARSSLRLCGKLLSILAAGAPVINISRQLAWQLKIVVNNIFQMHTRGAGVCKQCHE